MSVNEYQSLLNKHQTQTLTANEYARVIGEKMDMLKQEE